MSAETPSDRVEVFMAQRGRGNLYRDRSARSLQPAYTGCTACRYSYQVRSDLRGLTFNDVLELSHPLLLLPAHPRR